jgi:lipopolysaccharide heptosyltransferase II
MNASEPALERWADAKRILCVRLDTLGDVLMSTPAVRALKANGRRHVTLLTSPAGAEAARLVPEIDDVLVYDAPWMKATARRESPRHDREMTETLERKGFDAAAIFTVYSQSPLPAAYLAYMADIPLRLAHCRENPYQLLTDWIPEIEPDTSLRHEVRRQLDLVANVGARTDDETLSLRIPEHTSHRVDELLHELRISGRRWVAMHPGATAASRRYPKEGFADAARTLVRDGGYDVIFTGTEPERDLIAEIQRLMGVPSRSLAGLLDLAGLGALLARAPVLVSNNTGAVHVAAAVGTPVVDLYALTNPQHTPWQVPHRVLFHDVPCKYCYRSVCPQGHHHCLTLVPPEAIVRAVGELLDETPRSYRKREMRLVYLGH